MYYHFCMHGNIQNIQTIIRPCQMLIKSVVMFSLLINAVIFFIELSCCNISSLHALSFSKTLFSLFKHCLDLYITDSAQKVS